MGAHLFREMQDKQSSTASRIMGEEIGARLTSPYGPRLRTCSVRLLLLARHSSLRCWVRFEIIAVARRPRDQNANDSGCNRSAHIAVAHRAGHCAVRCGYGLVRGVNSGFIVGLLIGASIFFSWSSGMRLAVTRLDVVLIAFNEAIFSLISRIFIRAARCSNSVTVPPSFPSRSRHFAPASRLY